MKIAVVISGSIRHPHKSLESLAKLRDRADVDVFMHFWRNVGELAKDSHSGDANEEPTSELLIKYGIGRTDGDDWTIKAKELRRGLEWMRGRIAEDKGQYISGVGTLGQFYSLQKAWKLVSRPITQYDAIIRMRFDTLLIDNPLDHLRHFGWVIPLCTENDPGDGGDAAGGLNDQLAWFCPKNVGEKIAEYKAGAYFNLIDHTDALLRNGCAFHPETMLFCSIARTGQWVTRVPFRYTIRG